MSTLRVHKLCQSLSNVPKTSQGLLVTKFSAFSYYTISRSHLILNIKVKINPHLLRHSLLQHVLSMCTVPLL